MSLSLEDEENLTTAPLLSSSPPSSPPSSPSDPQSYDEGESPLRLALSSEGYRPQLSFWDYEHLRGEFSTSDESLVAPTAFRGSNFWNIYGYAYFRNSLFVAISLLPPSIFDIGSNPLKVYLYMNFIPTVLLIFKIREWLYYRKYGPVKYTNLMLGTSLNHCNTNIEIVLITLQLAKYHLLCKEYESALECCQKASNLPVTQNHVYYFILVCHVKVKALYNMERYEEAAQCQAEMLYKETTFAEKQLPISTLKRDYNTLANIQKKLGHNHEALQIYQTVVELLKEGKFEEHSEMGHAFVNIGDVQFILGKLDDAFDMYSKGLEIFRLNYGEFPKQTSVAKLHESIGDVFRSKNDIVSAKEHYEISFEVFRRSGRSDGDRKVMKLRSKLNNLEDHVV